jgi:hypothetical protein
VSPLYVAVFPPLSAKYAVLLSASDTPAANETIINTLLVADDGVMA